LTLEPIAPTSESIVGDFAYAPPLADNSVPDAVKEFDGVSEPAKTRPLPEAKSVVGFPLESDGASVNVPLAAMASEFWTI
jgi:hypothetical protein